MKRKQEDDSSADEPVKKKGKAKPARAVSAKAVGGGVGMYLAISLGITALVMVAGLLALGWLQFIKNDEITSDRLATEMARQQAALINTVITQNQSQATALVNSSLAEGAFLGALPQADVELWMESMMLDTNVMLIPAGSRADTEGLSFTARELLQRARREGVSSHAFLPGKPPTLVMVVRDDEGNTALVEKQLNDLARVLSRQELGGAYVAIKHSGGQVLITLGDQTSGHQASADVMGGISAQVTLPEAKGYPELFNLYAIIAGAMLLVVLLVVGSTVRALGRAVRKDAAVLANLATDLAGHAQASPRGDFAFPSLQLVTKSMRKLAEAGGAPGAPASRAAKSGAKDDNFPSVGAMDEAGDLTSEPAPAPTPAATPAHDATAGAVPAEIFRQYDIRGVAGDTLTEDLVRRVGLAVGTESMAAGVNDVVVARDGRESSPALAEALMDGLQKSGRNVIDLGMVPTPLLYYATKVLKATSGVMVTGSHNPPAHNGLKIVVAGDTLYGDRIQALRTRVENGDFSNGSGNRSQENLLSRYLQEVTQDIVMARPMKVVIDVANGVAATVAPDLLRQLGCEVTVINEQVDGSFPGHPPDTSKPENYQQLIEAVAAQGAEIGIAFDGDADRLGVVTPAGTIVWADQLMMIYARDLLTRSPGADIIIDVKCSRELARLINDNGGRAVMWKCGHSLVKAKQKELGSPLAGEMSGHIFFADRWHGFDDGMYAAARLLEILSLEAGSLDEVVAALPSVVSTPEITIAVPEKDKFALVQALHKKASAMDGTLIDIDGVRVDFSHGWGLVRASNTSANLVARFEGKDQAALEQIQAQFKQALLAVSKTLDLPF